MLNTPLADIGDEQIQDLLDELEQVTGLTVDGHRNARLLDYLMLTQRDPITERRRKIDAARFFPSSLLRTKISKLDGSSITGLVSQLCRELKANPAEVPHVESKTLYVFLNDVLNPKSKLRKLPPIRLW